MAYPIPEFSELPYEGYTDAAAVPPAVVAEILRNDPNAFSPGTPRTKRAAPPTSVPAPTAQAPAPVQATAPKSYQEEVQKPAMDLMGQSLVDRLRNKEYLGFMLGGNTFSEGAAKVGQQMQKDQGELYGSIIEASADPMGGLEMKDVLQFENNVNSDIDAATRAFNDATLGYEKVITGLNDPSSLGAFTGIHQFMKMLDQNSAVLAGEAASVRDNAMTMMEELQNVMTIYKDKNMPADVRQRVAGLSRALYQTYANAYKRHRGNAESRLGRLRGTDPVRALGVSLPMSTMSYGNSRGTANPLPSNASLDADMGL